MPKKRKTKRVNHRKVDRYEVNATFKIKSVPMSKSQANVLAKRARAKGGTATVRKA